MADVFISYSKARIAEAAELARDLTDLGFDVWWDTSLLPTGSFGAAIDRELDAAKAVIVMWSPEAVRSKWVRSEASHADRQDKLVNCHTTEITNPSTQLPKPFEQTHSVLADDIRGLVRALDALSVPRSVKLVAGPQAPAPIENAAEADDRLFAEVERAGTSDAYQFYLDELPQGRHATIARFRLSAQTATSAPPGPVVPTLTAPPTAAAGPAAATHSTVAEGTGVVRYKVCVGSGKDDRDVEVAPSESIKDAPFAPEMVLVPPGKFWMGSEEVEGSNYERPRHEVAIRYPLLVGKYTVTFDEWTAFDRAVGIVDREVYKTGRIFTKLETKHKKYVVRDHGWGRGRRPVVDVSWRDAKKYVAWLSEITGKIYRLLSEAEWEYACRAGTTTAYCFGEKITRQLAQFSEDELESAERTVDVGSFPANAFGLHDMHGNVWEWCEDAFKNSYKGAATDGAARTSKGPYADSDSRVLRGGGWGDFDAKLRSAYRYFQHPGARRSDCGFRVARTV